MIYLYWFSFYSQATGGELLETWAFTSYEEAVVNDAYPGLTFLPQAGITHSEIRYDAERNAGEITITVPRDFPIAQKFVGGYPYGTIYLRVIEVDGADAAANAEVIWRGKIRNSTAKRLTADLTGTDGREKLTRLGLRLNTGPTCQWGLYGTRCGVSKAGYTQTGTVTAVSTDGLTLTTNLSQADNYYKSGTVRGKGQAHMVTKNVGGVLTLMNPITGIAVGDSVEASKGCSRSASDCKTFNNYPNFSGFADFPTPTDIFSKGVL